MKEEPPIRAWLLAGVAGAATIVAVVAWLSHLPLLRWLEPQRGSLLVLPVTVVFLALRAHASQRESIRLRRSLDRLTALEAQLKEQAFHDPLTKLANRELFTDRVEHALASRHRDVDPLAVLFLDLDDFKTINDSMGHAAGDDLLVAAADRLRACVRPGDTTARLGGDEFAILLEETDSPAGAVRTAERVLESMQTPFVLGGREARVRASVGIAFSSPKEGDSEALLRQADVAMYRAKSQGKGCYAIYGPEMDDALKRRSTLRADLQRAMERDELSLAYQPIIDLGTGRVTGLEALLRWNHPRRGRLLPKDFLTVAEEASLMGALSRWVLERACAQVRTWQERYDEHRSLFVGVNLSGRQLTVPSLVTDVAEVVSSAGMDPHTLLLELPENVLLEDSEPAMSKLTALKKTGVRLALDNYGRGHLSPASLQRLPIDVVKIDKYFVDCIGRGAEGAELAVAVVKLAAALRLDVVAGGIESDQQWTTLRQLGTLMGQGYLLARPMAPASVEALLAADDRLRPDRDRPEAVVAVPSR